MRHKLRGRKLNRTSAHRKSMFANMAVSLVMHEQIHTTLPKAKEIRPYLEVLVTKAKRSDLATRRHLISKIKDLPAVQKLISVLGPRYKDRPGGYLRIIKTGFRHGDMAPMAYIEFVDRDVNAKGAITPRQQDNFNGMDQGQLDSVSTEVSKSKKAAPKSKSSGPADKVKKVATKAPVAKNTAVKKTAVSRTEGK
ncbi:MAG: ribosomal protein [Pseudomonadota bacterium]|jgi:large subunit ribosomal protein L17